MIDYIDTHRKSLYLCLFALSFISVFSYALPVFTYGGITDYDASVFGIIGKGWSQGLLPYRDLFDHKGPFFYLFYLLASFFPDLSIGLAVLSIGLFFIDLLIVYRIARLYLSAQCSWCIVLIAIVTYTTLMGYGTEELSVPFNLIPLYYLFKYLQNRKDKQIRFSSFEALIIGMCIGAHAMIRVNNVAPTAAGMLVLGGLFIVSGEWKTLFRVVTVSICGVLIFVFPFIVYFWEQSALDDFIYANFTFNVEYASGISQKNKIGNLIKSTYFPISLLLIIVNIFKKCFSKAEILTFASLVLSSVSVSCMGYAFGHYLVTAIPAYVITGCFALKMRGTHTPIKVLSILICFLLMLPYMRGIKNRAKFLVIKTYTLISHDFDHNRESKYKKSIRDEFLPYIPVSERNSFLVYGSFGGEYLGLNTLPCMKFFYLQHQHANLKHPLYHDSYYRMIKNDAPKWILVPTKLETIPSEMNDILNTKYRAVHSSEDFVLYGIFKNNDNNSENIPPPFLNNV